MSTTYEHTKGLAQQMSTTIRSAIALLLMLTLGSSSVWGQGPVVITTDTNGNSTIDDSEKKFYLIQTNAFPSFYIAPQANTITTNNILGEYMLWYFLDAGKDNPGTEVSVLSVPRISHHCLTPTKKNASSNLW